ncbi:hypothetical protein AU077_01080 [Streptococcus gallolyticus]|uniref:DUF3173 family protein n=1 Tax=Streptococcus gallolyticus TaxID=315405 RepID=UPI000733A287|nr:DUF3173 family protein [Streptococcus gallolyticus]ALT80271.1 hypothetical protein AU077_01080 [Streptococcus gallolyticus]MBS5180862.1 DUF3173 domain-containing protein [Streptococcus salivarius]MDU2933823.1 DUF3173 family protein [Streptococcus salivarius]
MTSKMTMTVQDIMDLGFSKWTAYNILRQAKHIMVERGFDFYDNKGLGTVPTTVVTEILGLEDITHG